MGPKGFDMEAAPIQVLHVEDDPIQALLVRELTAHSSSGSYHIHNAVSLATGLERLQQGGIDLILLDLSLGDSHGIDTLRTVHSRASSIPIIVFTGSDDESMAVASLKEGAQDYLIKGQARRDAILRSMRYAVERHRMEQELERERTLTRHIVLEAPTLICGIEPDGTTKFMNRAVEQVTGYDAHEVVGRNWWTLFYPGESARQVDGLLEAFARLGQVKDYEMALTCKDGTSRTISWNSVNRLDKMGRISEIIGIGSDVTERIRVSDALRRSEAFYHSLVESLPQNIFRKDLDGRFTFANQRFCIELELPLNRIIGSTDRDFFPPALADKYRADDQRVIATGELFETVEEYQPPEGPKEYVQVRKTAIRD
ncbi:MAG TPA: PAS domain-containing protein, partial [Roseimicrobium sp.]|nr:PAS domain-containing protein [Roseimicrobium sp.]